MLHKHNNITSIQELISSSLSDNAKRMKRSAIREILKLLNNPEMISFAGGLPSPESFPLEEVKEIINHIIDKEGKQALQYGTTEGDSGLRKVLIERHKSQGLEIKPENLAISTGSQQAIDLLGKILINPGDYVICGLPSYLGGITAFTVYGAKLEGIPFDQDGIKPKELESTIAKLIEQGGKIKFIYLIPDFQNPAGTTMTETRRKEILAIAEKYKLLVIEDSPYREIRFEGKHQQLMYELDKSGRVITLFTFSKIFAPGLRIAWLIGHEAIIEKFIMSKQSADVCSPVLLQKVAAEYIRRGLLDKNLKSTIELYRKRRTKMLEAFEQYMPQGVSWTHPEGGLFLFVTIPKSINSETVFNKAIEKNVAYVKGEVFHCNNGGKNTIRINFSYASEDQIQTGVQRLAKVIKNLL